MKLVIGTRGSKLALTQVDIISGLLKERFPELEFERKIIKTTGDKITDVPLAKIGGKGLFVKEIDEAVARGEVDFAVHSMKDVPTDLLPEIEIAATPEREDVSDALISREGKSLDELPEGAVVGTSSLRRRAQLHNARPDIEIRDLRGNVDTRLRKLNEGLYDAIIMARAGLRRMGFEGRITQVLPVDVFAPSVGQGAIAVVARRDGAVRDYLEAINHRDTMVRVTAERALLKQLGGGCQVPIGTFTRVDGGTLHMDAVVLSPDGTRKIAVRDSGPRGEAGEIGVRAGRTLLKNGAAEILEEVYGEVPEYG
ncbi:MAG: hydroxymethylbilane synthase [Euryarchaeota archaeon]|nr:hydroxymethylbilane synthase [Euryarchaeota archaeon]